VDCDLEPATDPTQLPGQARMRAGAAVATYGLPERQAGTTN
jgi:hypothetical protein